MDYLSRIKDLFFSSLNPFLSIYTILRALFPLRLSSRLPLTPRSRTLTPTAPPFSPSTCTVSDIRAAHSVLTDLGLPSELANMILYHASYFACVTTRRANPPLSLSAAGPWGSACPYVETDALGNDPMLVDLPYVRLEKVVFRITSHDQGWVDARNEAGSYRGAYSWFDACIWRRRENTTRSSGVMDHRAEDGWQGVAMVAEESSEAVWREEGDGSPIQALLGEATMLPSPGTQGFSGAPAVYITQSPESARQTLEPRGWAFVPVPSVPRRGVGGEEGGEEGSEQESEEPPRERLTWLLQRNVVAKLADTTHVVEWRRDDPDIDFDTEEWPDRGSGNGWGFVGSVKRGDRIGVWARCQVSSLRL
jgi:hypothetical protein